MPVRFYLAPTINTVPGGWKSSVVPYTLGTDTTTVSKFAPGTLDWALSYVDGPDEVHAQVQLTLFQNAAD